MTVNEKLAELGGKVVAGIDWRQTEFPTVEAAHEFINFLLTKDDKYEHRGIWRPWRDDQKWQAMVAWR